MAEHPNVARIRDGYAAFAKGDFAALTDLLAEDLVWHQGGRSQLAGDYRGREDRSTPVVSIVRKMLAELEPRYGIEP